jgi:hypothetical protein
LGLAPKKCGAAASLFPPILKKLSQLKKYFSTTDARIDAPIPRTTGHIFQGLSF